MIRFRTLVFQLFKQRGLRYWFYIAAFFIFVPVGYRFAALAWRNSSWVEKPLAVIAGFVVGIAAVVTRMVFRHVASQQVDTPAVPHFAATSTPANSPANEFAAAVRRRAAENRVIATGAGALGSTMGKGSYR